MNRKVLYFFALLMLVPIMYFTGGVESQLRFLYYAVMVLLIPALNSKSVLEAALTFCILYAMLPLAGGGAYPLYTVVANILSFFLMAIAGSRLSDEMQKERESVQKTADIFHGLTNALNLKVMNQQAKIDAVSESYERLQSSDKNKTRFISGVSHELRSPLSSIRSFSEILQTYDDIDADTRKEFLSIINEESERLTQLANEILDVVKMESGKVEWHMDYVNLEEIVKSAVKMMLPIAENKGLLVDVLITDKIPAIRGDRNKLLQVLLNLISNAVKFTAHGKITVGTGEVSGEIRTFVTDMGEGIYPEEREKIFEEFYRIGDDLHGRPKGSGLGLSISKKIVEAHGGRIWAESEIGKGSTFFFNIPRLESVMVGDRKGDISDHLDGRQILVLEDAVSLRHIMRLALEKLGYRTMGADSRMAVEVVRASKPHAIIIGYPEKREHVDEIRTLARVQGIPLVLAYIISDDKIGYQMAVNGYISKPFDSFQVLSTIEELLTGRTGRIMIVSDVMEDGRDLQTLIGTKGYDTSVVPAVDAINTAGHLPDVVILGTLPREILYRSIVSLRKSKATGRIPIILTLNIPATDIKCIGLGCRDYGSGLEELCRNFDLESQDAKTFRVA